MMVMSAAKSVSNTPSKPSRRSAATILPCTLVPMGRPNSSPRAARTLGAVCTMTWRVGSPRAAHTLSVSSRSTSAPVGQTLMHWPQPMQVESTSLPSKAQAMWVLKPRSTTLMTPTPWFSAQVEMQRRQMMHLELSFRR